MTESQPEPFKWQPGESHPDVEKLCREAYPEDKLFGKIMSKPKDHPSFTVADKLIHRKNNSGNRVLCIPDCNVQGRKLTELVIDQAHRVVGHMGTQITENYVHQYFWWVTLGTDVKTFCESCSVCQATKTSNQQPQGLLQQLKDQSPATQGSSGLGGISTSAITRSENSFQEDNLVWCNLPLPMTLLVQDICIFIFINHISASNWSHAPFLAATSPLPHIWS